MPSKILTAICLLLLTVTTQLNFAADKATWGAGQRTQVPVVMLSLDGFRHDYLARGHSPTRNDSQPAASRAEGLIPAFPPAPFLITTPSSPACTRVATGLSAIRFTTARGLPRTA